MNISIGPTLSELRKAKKLMQKDIAAMLSSYGSKVGAKTIYNWEKGLAQPSIPHFIALCDILDVDDVLWQFAGIPKGPYAGLNRSGRQKARDFIDLLFQIDSYRDITGKRNPAASGAGSADNHSRSTLSEEDDTVFSEGEHPDDLRNEDDFDQYGKPYTSSRLLRLYDIPVSAGSGNFLDDSSYQMIEAPTYVPIAVDFALRVSGDSMEPLILDGQVIWVKEQELLDSGDIGVFTYSNDVYCKKLIADGSRAYLRSLNPSYEDIEILDDFGFKVVGKVV